MPGDPLFTSPQRRPKSGSKNATGQKGRVDVLFNPPTPCEHGPNPHTPLGAGQKEL